jgi:hypothetical protein
MIVALTGVQYPATASTIPRRRLAGKRRSRSRSPLLPAAARIRGPEDAAKIVLDPPMECPITPNRFPSTRSISSMLQT